MLSSSSINSSTSPPLGRRSFLFSNERQQKRPPSLFGDARLTRHNGDMSGAGKLDVDNDDNDDKMRAMGRVGIGGSIPTSIGGSSAVVVFHRTEDDVHIRQGLVNELGGHDDEGGHELAGKTALLSQSSSLCLLSSPNGSSGSLLTFDSIAATDSSSVRMDLESSTISESDGLDHARLDSLEEHGIEAVVIADFDICHSRDGPKSFFMPEEPRDYAEAACAKRECEWSPHIAAPSFKRARLNACDGVSSALDQPMSSFQPSHVPTLAMDTTTALVNSFETSFDHLSNPIRATTAPLPSTPLSTASLVKGVDATDQTRCQGPCCHVCQTPASRLNGPCARNGTSLTVPISCNPPNALNYSRAVGPTSSASFHMDTNQRSNLSTSRLNTHGSSKPSATSLLAYFQQSNKQKSSLAQSLKTTSRHTATHLHPANAIQPVSSNMTQCNHSSHTSAYQRRSSRNLTFCQYCDRPTCTITCSRQCESCEGIFCTFCSKIDYGGVVEVNLCFDCAEQRGEGRDEFDIDMMEL